VPTTLSPDGRSRPPHLRSWRDGWRHLRFLLLFSPRWLFLYPGLALAAAGGATVLALSAGPLSIGSVTLDLHTMLFAAFAMIVGFQSMQFWIFAKVFAISEGLLRPDPLFERLLGFLSLERALIAGAILFLAGFSGAVFSVAKWSAADFGALAPDQLMRIAIPSGTAITLAFQVVYGSFFLSFLEFRTKGRLVPAGRNSSPFPGDLAPGAESRL
jgi:hypothetical protein